MGNNHVPPVIPFAISAGVEVLRTIGTVRRVEVKDVDSVAPDMIDSWPALRTLLHLGPRERFAAIEVSEPHATLWRRAFNEIGAEMHRLSRFQSIIGRVYGDAAATKAVRWRIERLQRQMEVTHDA